jgi:hypothetical protein
MTATYDPNLLTAIDRARKALGDTDVSGGGANATNSDEEISAIVSLWGEAEGTARLADAMIALFAQRPDHFSVVGGITVTWGSRIPGLVAVAKALRANAPVVGGDTIHIDAVVHTQDPYATGPLAGRRRP